MYAYIWHTETRNTLFDYASLSLMVRIFNGIVMNALRLMKGFLLSISPKAYIHLVPRYSHHNSFDPYHSPHTTIRLYILQTSYICIYRPGYLGSDRICVGISCFPTGHFYGWWFSDIVGGFKQCLSNEAEAIKTYTIPVLGILLVPIYYHGVLHHPNHTGASLSSLENTIVGVIRFWKPPMRFVLQNSTFRDLGKMLIGAMVTVDVSPRSQRITGHAENWRQSRRHLYNRDRTNCYAD